MEEKVKACVFSMTEGREFILKIQTHKGFFIYLKKSEIECIEIAEEYNYDKEENKKYIDKYGVTIHTKSGKLYSDSYQYDSEADILSIYL